MKAMLWFLFLATACGGSGHGASDPGHSTDVLADLPPDSFLDVQPDVPSESSTELPSDPGAAEALDIAVDPGPTDPIPPITAPLPLRVGVATRLMPVPLGIPTSGFGPKGGSGTPFTVDYPGSETIYQHPELKAVFVEGGSGRLILVRGDLVGFTATVREAVLRRLESRTGIHFGNELIIGGTHTHSGPGRLATGAFEAAQDKFFPEFFDRMMEAIVDVILDAYHDLEPARFGFTIAQDSLLHNDRRCENPEYQDPDMPLLRFDKADGSPKALVLVYAIHGTILGPDKHHLSQDVAGGIERKIQEGFDHPVPVLFFNSWAGDMAPGSAPEPSTSGPWSHLMDEYDRIEGLGNRARQTVAEAFGGIATKAEAEIASLSVWMPINREVIGYKDDEFPFPWGGVYCGAGASHCWVEGVSPDPIEGFDQACLPFPEELPAPDRTVLTVGRIGDLAFFTFPGEGVTRIGTDLRDAISKRLGKPVACFGYCQDYLGYSTPEWDYWQGGYEASGAIWGPKQGDYLKARILDVAHRFADPSYAFPVSPVPAFEPPAALFSPRIPTASLDAGKVATDVKASYGRTDVVEFGFFGGDPWLLMPLVVLERKDGASFQPFLRHNGTKVDSTSYEFAVTMLAEPAYTADMSAKARKFQWKVFLPITHKADQLTPIPDGTYRLHASGKWADSAGEVHGFDVVSGEFTVKL